MKFEWDEDKNLSNFRKHGIWFEEAQTIWADESSSEFFDPEHSDVEARFIRVGNSSVHRLTASGLLLATGRGRHPLDFIATGHEEREAAT